MEQVLHQEVSVRLFFAEQDAVPGAPVLVALPADQDQAVQVAAAAQGRAGPPDDLHQVLDVLHLNGTTQVAVNTRASHQSYCREQK